MKHLKTKSESRNPSKDGEMNFIEHLEEFRWVLVKSLIALIIGVSVVASFLPSAADFLSWPLKEATSRLGTEIGNLVTIRPLGVFSVFLQVCFFGGFGLALPFMLYFFAGFVSPGLTLREKRMLVPGCIVSLFLFLLGCAFSYGFILPLSLLVSMKFNLMLGYEIVWSASDYYGLVVWMTLLIGACFQFPLILMILVYAGVITVDQLRKARQIVVVIILIVSAVITPADPISMLILAIPLYILYELSLLAGGAVRRRKEIQAEVEARKGTDTEDAEASAEDDTL